MRGDAKPHASESTPITVLANDLWAACAGWFCLPESLTPAPRRGGCEWSLGFISAAIALSEYLYKSPRENEARCSHLPDSVMHNKNI